MTNSSEFTCCTHGSTEIRKKWPAFCKFIVYFLKRWSTWLSTSCFFYNSIGFFRGEGWGLSHCNDHVWSFAILSTLNFRRKWIHWISNGHKISFKTHELEKYLFFYVHISCRSIQEHSRNDIHRDHPEHMSLRLSRSRFHREIRLKVQKTKP